MSKKHPAFPDFHALRDNLRTVPDDMVHDCAVEMLDRVYVDAGLSCSDVLWLIESYERRRPRVHNATVTDVTQVRERLG